MIERKKAAATAPKAGYEDSTKNHIRATVRSLFRSGAKLTARETLRQNRTMPEKLFLIYENSGGRSPISVKKTGVSYIG